MERELFNNMPGSSLYLYMSQLQPFEGGHDADVAHGENEFDTPHLVQTECDIMNIYRWRSAETGRKRSNASRCDLSPSLYVFLHPWLWRSAHLYDLNRRDGREDLQECVYRVSGMPQKENDRSHYVPL